MLAMSARKPSPSSSFRIPAGEERRSRHLAAERFKDYLHSNHLKFTQEREAILREFYSIHEHIEADELLYRLRASRVGVSRATVYRTLDLLVQAGLARRVRLGKDRYHYEHILGREKHEHMICVNCERVIEWYDPELSRILVKNFNDQGFSPTRLSLQVFGYCLECVSSRAARDDLERVGGSDWL